VGWNVHVWNKLWKLETPPKNLAKPWPKIAAHQDFGASCHWLNDPSILASILLPY
jgi:hypothetical protein